VRCNSRISQIRAEENPHDCGRGADAIKPEWRPFQLAWILMNLRSIAEPTSDERNIVDLLFFPTGGGKTEAYLGLAAFTLVLRRLRNPGISSAGVSVLMRYTLRLLTLDQLSRASTLICALELERRNNAETLGEWPFEIGLWVGQAATPNKMGRQGDNDPNTARLRWRRFMDSSKNPSPIPLEGCPWCGRKFEPTSFRLLPTSNQPTQLVVRCLNRDCEFSRDTWLPIVAVDEPIYRRLPCFIIATVDKFAALPWTGPVGAFFGRVHRWDKKEGFYGPCDPTLGNKLPVERLLPPDLIIQDELHLISGPLGTMAGLYETALDELSTLQRDGKTIRPKIVASTATVRRAQNQIQALFARRMVDIFPPPGPDYRDSFFARTHNPDESNARLYVGVVAQGRSPKVAMLRVYLSLLGAGQKWYQALKKAGQTENAADAYMTLVGYFNSLRELGGSRRIIEDEVRSKLEKYSTRMRVGEKEGPFADRAIAYDPVELTSRVDTARVAEAKSKLRLAFSEKEHVDVAIATNMISVGLDILRLGLMVVFGQPKTTAELRQGQLPRHSSSNEMEVTMGRPCVCGGSNENCRFCSGRGEIADGLANALMAHTYRPGVQKVPIGRKKKGGRKWPSVKAPNVETLQAQIAKVHKLSAMIFGFRLQPPGHDSAPHHVMCPKGCGASLNPRDVDMDLAADTGRDTAKTHVICVPPSNSKCLYHCARSLLFVASKSTIEESATILKNR
jgi:hypothetical protein